MQSHQRTRVLNDRVCVCIAVQYYFEFCHIIQIGLVNLVLLLLL